MAFSTSLERAAFGNPVQGGWVNMKVLDPTGITVGAVTTVTANTIPAVNPAYTLIGTVKQLLPLGNLTLSVTSCNKPSGLLLLPKGSTVTG